jgi:hypothetical protein
MRWPDTPSLPVSEKMPLFRVLLHGQNFPGLILGKSAPIGFYTTRFVEADDEHAAAGAALAQLREATELNVPAEHRTKNAQVFIEEAIRVPEDTEQTPNSGFAFYEDAK